MEGGGAAPVRSSVVGESLGAARYRCLRQRWRSPHLPRRPPASRNGRDLVACALPSCSRAGRRHGGDSEAERQRPAPPQYGLRRVGPTGSEATAWHHYGRAREILWERSPEGRHTRRQESRCRLLDRMAAPQFGEAGPQTLVLLFPVPRLAPVAHGPMDGEDDQVVVEPLGDKVEGAELQGGEGVL
jgi:hypothetical protein